MEGPMNESTGGRGFLMFLLGATAGAVTALLTAPRSGRETRRRLGLALQQIQEKTSDLSISLGESYDRDEREGATHSSYPATSSSSRSSQTYRGTSPTK